VEGRASGGVQSEGGGREIRARVGGNQDRQHRLLPNRDIPDSQTPGRTAGIRPNPIDFGGKEISIILKNVRRATIQNYKEEAKTLREMIKRKKES